MPGLEQKSRPLLFALACLLPWGALAAPCKPITIEKTGPGLEFGRLVASESGQVVVTPVGQRLLLGRADAIGGSYGEAQFLIAGEPERAFRVTVGGQSFLSGPGGEKLLLSAITADPDGGVFGPMPTVLRVGGRLDLPARPASGRYSGLFDIRVEYVEEACTSEEGEGS